MAFTRATFHQIPLTTAIAGTPGVVVNGTAGNDTLDDLTRDATSVADLGRNDTINGGAGGDLIHAYNGNDVVNGGEGNDAIYDTPHFGETFNGNDTLNGEGGNDYFYMSGSGDNVVNGGLGSDTVNYLFADKPVWIDLASTRAVTNGRIDTLSSIENADGSAFDDVIGGDNGGNRLFGGKGNDFIDGGGGNDTVIGGDGNDTLKGGTGNDLVTEFATYGNNKLEGGAGNDTLVGGWGRDTMTGGDGADRFVFTSAKDYLGSGWDTITDFQHGIDKIDLSALDARPDLAGRQSFKFDSTRDGRTEEFFDGLSDDWQGLITQKGGPTINGDRGEIETRYEGGYTYVFLSTGDGIDEAAFRLQGDVQLTASDFIV
jgi:Ca2+-binding RTX toxin-like protein